MPKTYARALRKWIRCLAEIEIGRKREAARPVIAGLCRLPNGQAKQPACEIMLVSVVPRSESAVTTLAHIIWNIIDIKPDGGTVRRWRGRCPTGGQPFAVHPRWESQTMSRLILIILGLLVLFGSGLLGSLTGSGA